MKTSELRIGNLLQGKNSNVVVKSILIDGYLKIEGNTSWFLVTEINPCLTPVPLTEEWLLKFGFKWNDRYGAYHLEGDRNKEMIIAGNKDKMYVCDMDFHPSIKHVHQLQNLYYALTGEELAIKQPNI